MPRTIGGNKTTDFEQVAVDEWLPGTVEEVQFEKDREYTYKGETKKSDSVRFKFKLDGYQFPHYSRWMMASTNKKTNFYLKYLKYLCPRFDCEGKMIDLDQLTDAKIKIMFEQNGEYQNVTQIRGLDENLNVIASGQDTPEDSSPTAEEEPTF